jgi:hypothetical protein
VKLASMLTVMVLGTACGDPGDIERPAGRTTQAIAWGEIDGERHPYVGLVLVYDAEGPVWACSGALISPTVFLTAGGCMAPVAEDFDGDGTLEEITPVRARVSFQPDLTAGPPYAWGTPHAHPGYGLEFPNTRDLGVVRLDEPVLLARYASLAPRGTVDELAAERGRADLLFDIVGYGLHGLPDFATDLKRRVAQVRYVNGTHGPGGGYLLQTAESAATGSPCWGDAGGPVLIPGTDTIVAVVTNGPTDACAGMGLHYRTDTGTAEDFLE